MSERTGFLTVLALCASGYWVACSDSGAEQEVTRTATPSPDSTVAEEAAEADRDGLGQEEREEDLQPELAASGAPESVSPAPSSGADGGPIDYRALEAPLSCEDDADCPPSSQGENVDCWSRFCGPRQCYAWSACAAAGDVSAVCGCDGRTIPGHYIACVDSRNYAYEIPRPPLRSCTPLQEDCFDEQDEALFEAACDPDNELMAWTVLLEATGLSAYDGKALSVGGDPPSVFGGGMRANSDAHFEIEAGAAGGEVRLGALQGNVHVYIDDNDDGICNADETTFENTRRADALSGVLTITVAGSAQSCE